MTGVQTCALPICTRTQRKTKNAKPPAPLPPSRSVQLSPLRACPLPLLFALGLVGLAWLNSVRQNPALLWSFLGAAVALLAWAGGLLVAAVRAGRSFRLDISLRKQHYLQACAQGSVLLYWGWLSLAKTGAARLLNIVANAYRQTAA